MLPARRRLFRRAGGVEAGGWHCHSCRAAGRPAERVAGSALEELNILQGVEVDDEPSTLGIEVVYRARIGRTPLPATDVTLARQDLLTDHVAEDYRVTRLPGDTRHD